MRRELVSYRLSGELSKEQQFPVLHQWPIFVVGQQFQFVYSIADLLEVLFLDIIAISESAFVGIRKLVDTFAFVHHIPHARLNSVNVAGDFLDRLNHSFVINAEAFESIRIGDQLILVSDRRWNDMVHGQIANHARFDLNFLDVIFKADLIAGFQFMVA